MGRQMISFRETMAKLAIVCEWPDTLEKTECIMRYRDFKKILMLTLEVTTSERKCRELWKDLVDFQYARRANKSDTLIIRQDLLMRDIGEALA